MQTPEQIAEGLNRVDRKSLIAERIRERMWAICDVVPPIEPPAQYWLDSDACGSYCRDCVIKERVKEFGYGPPLRTDWWDRRTDLERAFWEGIDGGFDTESDTTEHCETCGKTLSYILTDYGATEELAYYIEQPLASVRDEDSYALDRLSLNVCDSSPRKQILETAIVINHAWRLSVREILITKEARRG